MSCGLYLGLLVGAGLGLLLAATSWVFPSGLGWWWFLAAPVLVVLAVIAATALNTLLAAVEWSLFAARRCPRCGRRRWSWGETRGFGF